MEHRSRAIDRPLLVVASVIIGTLTACTEPPPRPPAARVSIEKVACGSPSFCVTVPVANDAYAAEGRVPWVAAWDGQRWSPIPAPNLTARVLACADSWCLAMSDTGPVEGLPPPTIGAASWDGQRWRPVPLPSAPGTFMPTALDCWAPNRCLVSGSLYRSDSNAGLSFWWDGTSWTAAPKPPGYGAADVACLDADRCWFVFIAFYVYGLAWLDHSAIEMIPEPFATSPKPDVRCFPARGRCLTIASRRDQENPGGYTALNRDGVWEALPPPSGPYSPFHCDPDGCLVVANDGTTQLYSDGAWTTGPRGPTGYRPSQACASIGFCVVPLGHDSYDGSRDERTTPQFAHWDGQTWTTVTAAPNPLEQATG